MIRERGSYAPRRGSTGRCRRRPPARRAHDHFGRLVQTRVDDLHAASRRARAMIFAPGRVVEPGFPKGYGLSGRSFRGCLHAFSFMPSPSLLLLNRSLSEHRRIGVHAHRLPEGVPHNLAEGDILARRVTRRGIRFTFAARDPSFNADRHASALFEFRLRRTSFVRATCWLLHAIVDLQQGDRDLLLRPVRVESDDPLLPASTAAGDGRPRRPPPAEDTPV